MAHIRQLKPTAFILENVKGLKRTDDGKAFQRVIHTLENIASPGFYDPS